MRQRGDVVEAGVRAIHDVLMVAVVARPETVATIPKRRAALEHGRLRRLQRVEIGIVAVADRPGDRRAYQHECRTENDGFHRGSGTHRCVISRQFQRLNDDSAARRTRSLRLRSSEQKCRTKSVMSAERNLAHRAANLQIYISELFKKSY